MRRIAGAMPVALLWGLPFCLALLSVLHGVMDADAWHALFRHSQLWPALGLSLWVGSAATLLALAVALLISASLNRCQAWQRLQAWIGAALALPHLAFAIGFGFLIMPSGLVARLFVGGATPPQWVTTQDPYGLSLIAALTLKEVPFLLAMIWSLLARGDVANALHGQWRAARSLGHAPGSIWLRVIQPQLLRRLIWPLVIVWVYGATVVDMALVLGPTQPPLLSVVIWRDLNDANTAINARGLAGAAFLSAILTMGGLVAAGLIRGVSPALRPSLSTGPSRLHAPWISGRVVLSAIVASYVVVMALLIIMSASARWPYPALWPAQFRLTAAQQLVAEPAPLFLSLGLGLATSIMALALSVLWFETQPPKHDRVLLLFAVTALGLPQLVIAAGQYRLFLGSGLAGSVLGLFLAHLTPVFGYAVIVLSGPYRAFDRRYVAAARSLGAGASRRWWRIVAPMLRAPLLTTVAIGFSVSMVQFVPAQLIAAGRHATLPMEAVTLASGGSRALLATYALALALPPLFAFVLASRWGRPRWS